MSEEISLLKASFETYGHLFHERLINVYHLNWLVLIVISEKVIWHVLIVESYHVICFMNGFLSL